MKYMEWIENIKLRKLENLLMNKLSKQKDLGRLEMI